MLEVTILELLIGEIKLNTFNFGIPLFRIKSLGPFVAFRESFGLLRNAQTSHLPTSESPGATPRLASIASRSPRFMATELEYELIVIFSGRHDGITKNPFVTCASC